MPLKFRKNGTTYTGFPPSNSNQDYYVDTELSEYESDHTPIRWVNLCYKKNGKTYYAPCTEVVNSFCTTGRFRFTYDPNYPSLAVRKNGTTYYLVNRRWWENVMTEIAIIQPITYTRAKQSNGYYKFTFTIKYQTRACYQPKGKKTGNWGINVIPYFDDMTYTVAKSGTYNGTTEPSQTTYSSTKTATISITATGGDTSAKSRGFGFTCYSSDNTDYNHFSENGYSMISVTESWQETYSIPAGTYTPSAFRSLIEQYISNNGNRTCSNTFTAKVNGQTITVNSGSKIYYQVLSSSPQGNARSVYFGTAPQSGFAPAIASNSSTNGFTNGKAYVVYNSGGGFNWTEAYKNYANYSITIGTGINFS